MFEKKNSSLQTLLIISFIAENRAVMTRSSARPCRSMSSYRRVLQPVAKCLPPDLNRSFFFLSISLILCGHFFDFFFAPDLEFFFQKRQSEQKVKFLLECPNSAIDSPHVEYV